MYVIGHENKCFYPTNRTADSTNQSPAPDPGGHAPGKPLPAIQRLRQAGLPLQGPPASQTPRSLLPVELGSSGQEHDPVHPSPLGPASQRPVGDLQAFPQTDGAMGRLGADAGQNETQSCLQRPQVNQNL